MEIETQWAASIFYNQGLTANPCEINGRFKGSLPPPKNGFIWEKIQNVGGWGQSVPNFYKSLFFMAYLTPL